MRIVNLAQGSPEWHEHRKTHYNASEAPCVMGCSPWAPKTMHDLVSHKMGSKTVYQNAAMRRGTELEPRAREAYERTTGNIVEPIVGVHDDLPLYSASLDGMTFDGDLIVEIKCPAKGTSSDSYQKALNGSAGHYIWQIQHQLFVSGAKVCEFFVFDGIDQGVLLPIVRDDAMIAKLIAEWEKFGALLSQGERDDEAWIDAANRYKVAKCAYDAAKVDYDASQKRLKELAMGDKTTGHGVTVTRFRSRGGIDYEKIPELQGIDLEGYRKPPVESVKITLGEDA